MVRSFHVYIINGRLVGYEMDWMPYPKTRLGYRVGHLIVGKNASYCIVSDDERVTRSVAIQFATAHYEGNFKTYTIDLSKVGRNAK